MMNSTVTTDHNTPAPVNGMTVEGIPYTISDGDLPVVRFELENGESILSEKGAMAYMTAGMHSNITNQAKDSSTLGQIGRLAKRKLSGEALFLQEHSARDSQQEITLRTTLPGEIVAINLGEGDALIMQRGAFLASDPGVNLDLEVRTNIGSGLFGGEGFLMQRATGPGTVFVSMGGNGIMRELEPGEKLTVSTGAVGAFDPSVTYEVERVRGGKNIFFGGEGLFNTTVTGPGRVWIQSLPARDLARTLQPYLLSPGKDNIGDAGLMTQNLGGVFGKMAEVALGS